MIENYLLEYLVTFDKSGTLHAAAQQLGVSPASVSRGLTKLERLLNVELFDHQPQRLILTPTGKFTARQADALLAALNEFPREVQNFAAQERAIRISGTIIGPLLLLRQCYGGKAQLDFKMTLQSPGNLAGHLLNNQATLVIATHPCRTPLIEAQFVGEESLAIKVTKLSPFYHQRQVSFTELNHHSFVVAPNIGEWKAVIEQNIPHAHFLYQMEPSSLHELTKNSIFPLFRTNITHYLESFHPVDQQRRYIRISDEAACLPIYALYEKKDRNRVAPLIKWLQVKLNTIK